MTTPAARPVLDAPEFRLIAAACAASATGTALSTRLIEGVNLAEVLALIERHRLSAAVRRIVGDALAGHAPEAAATLQAGARRQRVLAFEQARQTVALSRLLATHGIAHLVVKGAPLSQLLYGNLAARSSKDIDLLVAPARLAAAGDAIAAAGFARSDDEDAARKHRTYAAGMIQIELHDRLVDLPSYVPLAFDDLWARRTTVPLLGHDVPVMGDIDTLIYLCAHGAEHAWFRLKWLQDIARIVVRDGGDGVATAYHTAEAAGFDRVFVAMLRLVDELFGIRPAATYPGGGASDRAVALARTALAAPADLAHVPTLGWIVRRSLVQLGLRRDWRYRRDLIADMAIGPRSFDPAQRGSWGLLHLPVRAVRFWRSRS